MEYMYSYVLKNYVSIEIYKHLLMNTINILPEYILQLKPLATALESLNHSIVTLRP